MQYKTHKGKAGGVVVAILLSTKPHTLHPVSNGGDFYCEVLCAYLNGALLLYGWLISLMDVSPCLGEG